MSRIIVLKLLGILAAIVFFFLTLAIVFAGKPSAPTGNIAFGGEAKDNFWSITTRYCRDGFTVSAAQTQLSNQRVNFWLELAASRLPINTALPSTIASGDGNSFVNAGQPVIATFLFNTLQAPMTPISITIERWDHNLPSAFEQDSDGDANTPDADRDADGDDSTDESHGDATHPNDDIMFAPGGFDPTALATVEDCLLSDTTAPVATAALSPSPNTSGWNNTNVIVQLHAADESGGSGVKEITYSASGAQPIGNTTVSGNSTSITISAEGQTTITYFATDKSGNVETPQAVAVKLDKTAPGVTIINPKAQSYLQTAAVPVSWTASDSLSGVASTSATLDGSAVINGQVIDLFFQGLGSHTVTVKASDNAGNAAQASVTFNVVATIDSLGGVTQRACSMGWISNKGACNSLGAKLQAAKAALARGQSTAARGMLNAYLAELKAQRGKAVNQQAYALLAADVQYLLVKR